MKTQRTQIARIAAGIAVITLLSAGGSPSAGSDAGPLGQPPVRQRPGRLSHLSHPGAGRHHPGHGAGLLRRPKNSGGDTGDIDLLVKRSADHGQTWSGQQVVWDDAGNTCGNPCAGGGPRHRHDLAADDLEPRRRSRSARSSPRRARTRGGCSSIQSTDDGLTWSKPREITAEVKLTNWTWYATGPGSGIQIEHGPHQGRLVIPCDHIEADTKHYYSHVIYSDDHGKTWKLGGSTPQHQVNECEVVELAGGRLMLNMRNYDRAKKNRQVAFSDDGGLTWKDQRFDEALIEPICQAAIERYRWPEQDKPRRHPVQQPGQPRTAA